MHHKETDLSILNDCQKVAGIVRAGVTYHDWDGTSWTQWVTMEHKNRSNEKLIEVLEEEGFFLGSFDNTPDWDYDCSGQSFGYGPKIRRGKTVAVITAWRGLDV